VTFLETLLNAIAVQAGNGQWRFKDFEDVGALYSTKKKRKKRKKRRGSRARRRSLVSRTRRRSVSRGDSAQDSARSDRSKSPGGGMHATGDAAHRSGSGAFGAGAGQAGDGDGAAAAGSPTNGRRRRRSVAQSMMGSGLTSRDGAGQSDGADERGGRRHSFVDPLQIQVRCIRALLACVCVLVVCCWVCLSVSLRWGARKRVTAWLVVVRVDCHDGLRMPGE